MIMLVAKEKTLGRKTKIDIFDINPFLQLNFSEKGFYKAGKTPSLNGQFMNFSTSLALVSSRKTCTRPTFSVVYLINLPFQQKP